MLRVVSSVLRAVRLEYVDQAEVGSATPDYTQLHPMTWEEMAGELNKAMTDYENGEYITLEDMTKESATPT